MAAKEQIKTESQQFSDFKRQLNVQAAQAQLTKLELNLTDVTVSSATLKQACADANSLKLGAICVLPCLVRACTNLLGSDPQTSLIACISSPHGGDTIESKAAMVKNAVKDGVDEVEVTAPITFIKDGNWGYVKREFKIIKRAAKKRGVRINVEASLLTPQELTKVCALAVDCGITSLRTGSAAYGGFKPETIAAIKTVVKDKCTIKADGITTFGEMQTAVDMGASIVGSKNAVEVARLILQVAEE